MENHRYNGAISGHFKNVHERRPTTNELLQNSTILHRVQNFQRLAITEAVCIELRKPLLNIQREFDLVLPSCRRKRREIEPLKDDPPRAPQDLHPADPQQPTPAGGRQGGNAPRQEPEDDQQDQQNTTDYVRLRLRPRTRPGARTNH